jgi:hypothetical protein
MNTLPTVAFGLTRVWIVFWVRDLYITVSEEPTASIFKKNGGDRFL